MSRDYVSCPGDYQQGTCESPCRIVIWFHDKSTFYANDCRTKCWVHKTETAVPCAKGEGVLLMVADFMSADYGWLQSPDGQESARILFKAGKQCDGYFTHDDILKQATVAMDILQKCYPDDDHMFIYDNATIHTKRGNGALSACHMPKSKPKNSHEWDGMDWGTGRNPKNWGVEVNVVGADGKPIYGPNGAIL